MSTPIVGQSVIPLTLFEPRGRWGHVPSLADLIDASGDCWEWTGNINSAGYGRASYNDRIWLAHRLVWSVLVGPVDDALHIDHLCYNPPCVNPDHLRAITPADHVRARRWTNSNRTHCPAGHEYTPENTYNNPSRPRHRICRACSNAKSRDYKRRVRSEGKVSW